MGLCRLVVSVCGIISFESSSLWGYIDWWLQSVGIYRGIISLGGTNPRGNIFWWLQTVGLYRGIISFGGTSLRGNIVLWYSLWDYIVALYRLVIPVWRLQTTRGQIVDFRLNARFSLNRH